MVPGIPDGITREDVLEAIKDFAGGVEHDFDPSTSYDLLESGNRYPPKAVLGLAARRIAGRKLTPKDFKGGEGSKCFRILRDLGFEIVLKEQSQPPSVPFVVGEQYGRDDVYRIMEVPEDRQRGNWETGYNRWGDDLFLFTTVGAAATGGYDYDNGWEGDLFRWYAKENTRLDHPQIQWMLTKAKRVFVFTRPAIRTRFTFEGLGTPDSFEDQSPVLIRWRIHRESATTEFATLPTEESSVFRYIEGATRVVAVNAYERSGAARQSCLTHWGYDCAVCGFNFAKIYGSIGDGFIHVHHLRDLATVGGEYEVDAINDLRPVCPNCHAMLHTSKPAMSIERLQGILKQPTSKI